MGGSTGAHVKFFSKLARSIRKRLDPNQGRLTSGDRAQVFSAIYASRTWNEGTSDESASGDGSTVAATVNTRRILERVIREHGVRSLLDAPCGDFNWMRHVPLDALGVTYTGADIVPDLIARNRERYGGPGRSFARIDLVADPPPPAHDLVLCRDCIMHLPNADIARLLANISASGSKLLLLTVHPRITENTDIDRVGGYHGVNPSRPPFSLGEPIFCEPDEPADRPKFDRWLALYRLPVTVGGDGGPGGAGRPG